MPIWRNFTTFHAFIVYALIRALSFLTYNHEIVNQIFTAILVACFAYVCVKKLPLAWTVLVAEFLLDGSGRFFELSGLLLRTWFLVIFVTVWIAESVRKQFVIPVEASHTTVGERSGEPALSDSRMGIPFHISKETLWQLLKGFPPLHSPLWRGRFGRNDKYSLPRIILVFIGLFTISLAFSVLNGFFRHNMPIYIFQDITLYLFLFLLFPALEFQKEISDPLIKIAKGYILGSAAFSFITFFIYSGGIGILPDAYYHWFRNVAGGKITDLGSNFFRVVLPEHLIIVPVILVLASFLMRDIKNKKLWLFLVLSSFVLALNFTRIYFIGLAAGMIFLAYRQNFKRWLVVSATSALCVIVLFAGTHLAASSGQSLGLELLGVRFAGVAAPAGDVSGAIRLAILPNAVEIIKQRPWLGSGLGTMVTFISPVTNQPESRTQFDWGYLEMIAELGIIGTVSYLALLLLILYSVWRKAFSNADTEQNFLLRGLLAGGITLFFINITTPALFQGFGVLFFVACVLIERIES